MKQELKRAIGNLEWALDHLARVIIVYKDEHIEVAAPLVDAATALEAVIEVIKTVDDHL